MVFLTIEVGEPFYPFIFKKLFSNKSGEVWPSPSPAGWTKVHLQTSISLSLGMETRHTSGSELKYRRLLPSPTDSPQLSGLLVDFYLKWHTHTKTRSDYQEGVELIQNLSQKQ